MYADLVGRGVAGSQACGARAALFESYLQYMLNDVYATKLKYIVLNLSNNWAFPVYDAMKALDISDAQYSQYGVPCTLLPDVDLYYQILY